MIINFKCHAEDFWRVEIFLFEQEYSEKPPFDALTLTTELYTHHYVVDKVGDYWYIITE